MQVDTSEFRALAADVAAIKKHLERVRFDQAVTDEVQAIDGIAVVQAGFREGIASARGRRRVPRRDRARAPHLRPAGGGADR